MPTKFLKYDKSAIAQPGTVAERLLQTPEDSCYWLAVSDCYNLEAGDESLFEEALDTINHDFDRVLATLSASLGEPAFVGTDKDEQYPTWAGTGYRVAYWMNGKRILYLHVTHVGTIAPLELNLGVVTSPARNWVVGT